jgi:hypothetical protein
MEDRLYNFYLGVDLGQARDYTAIALLEESAWVPEEWRFRRPGGSSPRR